MSGVTHCIACASLAVLFREGLPVCSVDLVLCLGDSLNMSTADQSSDEKIAVGEGEFGHIVACLENIACAVAYIPGNVSELCLALTRCV